MVLFSFSVRASLYFNVGQCILYDVKEGFFRGEASEDNSKFKNQKSNYLEVHFIVLNLLYFLLIFLLNS